MDKLGNVSPVWTETFPPAPNDAGYKKLQRLITKYGYAEVRSALQFALEKEIVPHKGSGSAMPVLVGILKAAGPTSTRFLEEHEEQPQKGPYG